jgi:hypothetical protein
MGIAAFVGELRLDAVGQQPEQRAQALNVMRRPRERQSADKRPVLN